MFFLNTELDFRINRTKRVGIHIILRFKIVAMSNTRFLTLDMYLIHFFNCCSISHVWIKTYFWFKYPHKYVQG